MRAAINLRLTFSDLSLRWKLGEESCFFKGLWAFLAFLAAASKERKHQAYKRGQAPPAGWEEELSVNKIEEGQRKKKKNSKILCKKVLERDFA